MSKIGQKPITIPNGVTVAAEKGGIYGNQLVKVTGPKGTLEISLRPDVTVAVDGQTVNVTRSSEESKSRALHGLYRSMVANMVFGVVNGYEKKLEIQGVGYRGAQKGQDIELSLGFIHKVNYKAPAGIEVRMLDETNIQINGADKQMVGQVAAEIRQLRKPEPYKGKGIRYLGEQVRKKAGKAAAKTA
jgi:large subunit ribosomal protein L6